MVIAPALKAARVSRLWKGESAVESEIAALRKIGLKRDRFPKTKGYRLSEEGTYMEPPK